jgi:hypothetical protein
MIGIVMGIPSLREIFEEKYYSDLEGGILESFGPPFQKRAQALRLPISGRQHRLDHHVE